jgi:predicted TIM-barrel fold metal-dependent hydrolase
MTKHNLSRRDIIASTAAVGTAAVLGAVTWEALAGTARAQTPGPELHMTPAELEAGPAVHQLTAAERARLGWVGVDLPKEALDGPWRNLRAVKEKQIIDAHVHPWETKTQGDDNASTRAAHADDNLADMSDYMIASMDYFGIGYVVCNPAFASFEKQIATSFKKHSDRLWLSCGLPSEETQRRGGVSKMTPEEVAEILRAQIKKYGAVMIGETAAGAIRNWAPKDVKPIIDVAVEYDMPLQLHTGWGQTATTSLAAGGKPYESASTWAEDLARYIQSYPEAKFMLGHQGGQMPLPDGWEAVRLFYSFDNVIAEVSKVQPQIIEACVRGRGADRVVWGSDWNRPEPKNYGPYLYRNSFQHWWNLNNIAVADITEDERDWVLYKSIRRMLHLPARPNHVY